MIDFKDVDTIINHGLAFLRTGAIVFTLPIIGDSPTPVPARVLLAAALTTGVMQLIPTGPVLAANADLMSLAVLVLKELVIGVTIGYLARISFDGLLMAASMSGYQMGFGTASLFLPDAGQQLDTFTAFHRVILMTIFLMLNLHHLFIDALVTTFQMIPVGKVSIATAAVSSTVFEASAKIFKVALQLGAPVLIALMFTQAALGMVARAVPQLNVFIVSFPMSFAIGLIVYIATMPFFPEWMGNHYLGTKELFLTAIKGMQPG